MNFFKKVSTLIEANIDSHETMDHAGLYCVYQQPHPLAKHVIFSPMPDGLIKHMIENYKRTFPEQLLVLYTVMNGANLFCTVRLMEQKKTKRTFRIPHISFSIYGIPLTYDRMHIEPFNISIEDLNRPAGTPDSWLKFGCFCRPEELSKRMDLFVDVECGQVYAIDHDANECCISETWNSVDNCLCHVFDLFGNSVLTDLT